MLAVRKPVAIESDSATGLRNPRAAVASIARLHCQNDRWRNALAASKGEQLRRIPLGRVGEPGNVVDPIVFLASPDAAMITGATLAIDGQWRPV